MYGGIERVLKGGSKSHFPTQILPKSQFPVQFLPQITFPVPQIPMHLKSGQSENNKPNSCIFCSNASELNEIINISYDNFTWPAGLQKLGRPLSKFNLCTD